MLTRFIALAYGVVCYLVFFATTLYLIGFLGDLGVPRSIDSGPPTSPALALLIDAALIGMFAAQHSLMARPWFKRVWIRIVPEPVERATYVLCSSLALFLVCWQWRPMGGQVWSFESPTIRWAFHGLYFSGWLLLIASTCMIDHLDLFGLRQVWERFRGRAPMPLEFRETGLYRHIRHPIYLSWLCIFWATPQMSVGHFVFATITTAYIFAAVRFEERDLIEFHGEVYRRYRERVPMLIPVGRGVDRSRVMAAGRKPNAPQGAGLHGVPRPDR